MPRPPNPLDWKICNCARCKKELLGESMRPYVELHPYRFIGSEIVCARVNGRPYCKACLPAGLME